MFTAISNSVAKNSLFSATEIWCKECGIVIPCFDSQQLSLPGIMAGISMPSLHSRDIPPLEESSSWTGYWEIRVVQGEMSKIPADKTKKKINCWFSLNSLYWISYSYIFSGAEFYLLFYCFSTLRYLYYIIFMSVTVCLHSLINQTLIVSENKGVK